MSLFVKNLIQLWTAFVTVGISLNSFGSCSSYKETHCNGVAFSPKCGSKAVIMMQNADYGRMEEGVCGIEGHLGCSKSVLDVLQSKCSGKRNCSVFVGDTVFGSACDQFVNYLATEHICQNVIESGSSNCQPCNSRVMKVVSPQGFLSSETTAQSNCGSSNCPWMIEAPDGQTIIIILYRFSNKIVDKYDRKCPVYAMIKENKRTISLEECAKSGEGISIYNSSSSKITINLVSYNEITYLLEYKFIGCNNNISNNETIFNRQDNTAKLKCKNLNKEIIIECINNEWKGLTNMNCSEHPETDEWKIYSSISWELWTVSTSSIVFLFGCCFIIIYLWCFCRNNLLENDHLSEGSINVNTYDEIYPPRGLPRNYPNQYIYDELKNCYTESRK